MAEDTGKEGRASKRKSKTLIKILSILFLLGAAGAVGAYFYFDWAAKQPQDPSGSAPEQTFVVPKGATASQVGSRLAEEGLISSTLVWKVYLKLHDAPAPKAGKHKVSAGMNIPELLDALSGAPVPDDVKVTMVEGWRLTDADEFLSAKGLFDPGAFVQAASKPKDFKIEFPFEGDDLLGYMLPETYLVPVLDGKVAVDRLVQMQLDAFAERFAKPHAEEISKSGRSLRELVIIASLLEREEPNPEQRPAVAGVMYKRLDSNTPLGIDATSRFTIENWNDRQAFLKKLRDPNDPYNTRLRKGLPPGPIGAPSLESLLAALRPKMGPYWYYLHDAQGKIHFSRNAAEHEANRKKYNVY